MIIRIQIRLIHYLTTSPPPPLFFLAVYDLTMLGCVSCRIFRRSQWCHFTASVLHIFCKLVIERPDKILVLVAFCFVLFFSSSSRILRGSDAFSQVVHSAPPGSFSFAVQAAVDSHCPFLQGGLKMVVFFQSSFVRLVGL